MNYKKMYEIYKKLPLINFITTCVLSLAWGIIDYCEFITAISDLDFGAIFIWLLIGAAFGGIVMFFTCVAISPTILRTDATLEINNKINN